MACYTQKTVLIIVHRDSRSYFRGAYYISSSSGSKYSEGCTFVLQSANSLSAKRFIMKNMYSQLLLAEDVCHFNILLWSGTIVKKGWFSTVLALYIIFACAQNASTRVSNACLPLKHFMQFEVFLQLISLRSSYILDFLLLDLTKKGERS